ncbi:MAG TPA: nucleotidyltransferase domain-containing protein [Caldilineaceae bacterium]|nr:nucleotidyltransferase domain-containing protein [Caldilineaceae bacterium]
MKTTIPAEQMARYRQTAERLAQQEQTQLAERRQRGLAAAQRAADCLKQEFGVSKVLVFGSLVNPARFHSRSDIDLVVWGLAERDYYRAVGRLQGIDPEFEVDLLRSQDAPVWLAELIAHDGVAL